jgi:hypothetical protein
MVPNWGFDSEEFTTVEKEQASIVQKPREEFEDILLPENTGELARLMDEPTTAIAEIMTSAFAAGPKAWMVMGGRIVQGMLKAKLFQQVSREIRELREKGKILDDFADENKHKYGFKSWVELLTVIDEETPDADRLDALKAMFYGVNKVNPTDGERIAAYQLFQIAKKVTSGQLLYLKASYELYKASDFRRGELVGTQQWLAKIGKKLGHTVIGLMDQDDLELIKYGLLTPRTYPDLSGVNETDAHLTQLGIAVCQNIETYHVETFAHA